MLEEIICHNSVFFSPFLDKDHSASLLNIKPEYLYI